MNDADDSFSKLIERVRRREAAATAELVRRFEPEIRLRVRTWLRLRDPGLRRAFDTMDICQSVMAQFFALTSAGEFTLDDPDRVIRLLSVMARNKLSEKVKHHQAQRRDVRRSRPIEFASTESATDDSPSQILAAQEILEAFRSKLSDEERDVSDLRALGLDWPRIAAALGGSAEARRKQWARAVDRIARQLGLAVNEPS